MVPDDIQPDDSESPVNERDGEPPANNEYQKEGHKEKSRPVESVHDCSHEEFVLRTNQLESPDVGASVLYVAKN